MAYNTIKVKKYSDVIEEYEAAAAITPGMLVEVAAGLETIQAHSTDGGNALPMFALEDEMQGNEIDDDYAAGDPVQVWIPYRGDIVYVLLADDEVIEIGDWLVSDGEGKVKELEVDAGDTGEAEFTMPIVGQALEARDQTMIPSGSESSAGGDYYNPRILMRVV